MKKYMAFVTDPYDGGRKRWITSEANSLKEFLQDCHANGYKISDKFGTEQKCLKILNETNGEDWEWHPGRNCYKGEC